MGWLLYIHITTQLLYWHKSQFTPFTLIHALVTEAALHGLSTHSVALTSHRPIQYVAQRYLKMLAVGLGLNHQTSNETPALKTQSSVSQSCSSTTSLHVCSNTPDSNKCLSIRFEVCVEWQLADHFNQLCWSREVVLEEQEWRTLT